jgi:outer membrane lipoprotein-sorting protein
MKSSLKILPSLLVMISFFGIAAVKDASAQGVLREILKRMEDHHQKLTSLRANVKMDKFNAQLGEHDISEGTTIYVPQKGRDALVRVDWTKPLQESLAIVNKEYVLYRPHLKQAIRGKVNKAQNSAKGAGSALAFMNMSKAQLQANYTVNYLGQENLSNGTPTWHLELIPKTATSYRSAELWVDGNGMPVQAKVIENNNDSTTVLLHNLQKNVNIRLGDIPISPPKGTKVIEG